VAPMSVSLCGSVTADNGEQVKMVLMNGHGHEHPKSSTDPE